MDSHAALLTGMCQSRLGAADRLAAEEITRVGGWLPDWLVDETRLERVFAFKNFHETMAFVNAVAAIAHTQDHHPDLHVSYNRCTVVFTTHSAGGLTWNDAICAALCDAAVSDAG